MDGKFEKRLQRLEKQLHNLSADFDELRKETDDTTREFNKEFTHLVDNDAAFSNRFKTLDKVSKVLVEVDKELSALHEEINEERKSFTKEVAPLFDADSENKKKIKNLENTSKNIMARIETARGETAKLAANVSAFEKVWNPNVLKRVSNTLGDVNKTIAAIEKRDSKNVRNLDKVHSGIFAIAKHAAHIEAEHIDTKMAAGELAKKAENLKDTMDYFFKQSESLNNRINANTTGLADIANTLDVIKDKLLAVEGQSAQLSEIKDMLAQNSKNIDQLTQRLAYLEKATVKTIVLE